MKSEIEDTRIYELAAVQLALDMYKQFAQDLITALKNTSGLWNEAKWQSRDVQGLSYCAGKQDAFGEIAERVAKEYGLAMRGIGYLEQVYDGTNEEGINTRSRNLDVVHNIFKKIGYRKNEDVDKMFPDEQYRGTGKFHEVLKLKGKVADLLENYAGEAFNLGRLTERKFGEKVPNDLLVDEYNTLIDKLDKELPFNPKEFADMLCDQLIPSNYRDALKYKCNAKNIYNGENREYEKYSPNEDNCI